MKLNPGTFFKVERETDGKTFRRLAFIPHYVSKILNFLLPVIGLDCGANDPIKISIKDNITEMLKPSKVILLTGRIPGNQIVILGIVKKH